jgi:hypothetical protein
MPLLWKPHPATAIAILINAPLNDVVYDNATNPPAVPSNAID